MNAASIGESRTKNGKGLCPDDVVLGTGSFDVKTRFTPHIHLLVCCLVCFQKLLSVGFWSLSLEGKLINMTGT